MDLYCLRVRRETAGKMFPFDRVYIARNGEHTVFKGMFRYALILPVEEGLKNLLLDYVKIDTGEAIPFDRDDNAPVMIDAEWKALLDEGEWVMCVPILAKYVASNMPRYLTAAGKYRDPTGQVRRRRRNAEAIPIMLDPFPTLTYLQTPDQNIRPVCVACPNFINHQNGHCRLGEEICYSSLALGMGNHFQEGIDVPAATTNVLLTAED